MTETLQLEEVAVVPLHDAPKLLVEWSPRWQDFVTSIGPAFSRSGGRLAGEAPHGIFPYRGMIASWLLQAFLLFVGIVLPGKIKELRPYAPPKLKPYEVIYYSGDELPRIEDLGGAQAGATGRAGGQEAHQPTQTIHVARGGSLAPQVVDAPNLKLPATTDAVANLLAFKSTPGPPPAEGLRSSLKAPSLPANVIAPAPANIHRDQSRGGVTLDSAVVAPAPNVSADNARTAPALNAAVVPPAPSVRSEHTLYTPHLDPSIIAPAPSISQQRTQAAPALNPNIIAPATARVSRDQPRAAPALGSSVVPPAPNPVSREVSPSRVQMNNVAVVPPPVSAPERETSRTAKLNLPAPSVIAPPPSPDSTRDLRRLESGSIEPSRTVVPPPPTPASGSATTSTFSSLIGKIFGTQDIVPPPPTVSGSSSGTNRNPAAGSGTLAGNVIAPPPTVSGAASGSARGGPGASGDALATNIVPPPPSIGGSGRASGGSAAGRSQSPTLGGSNVIAPPPLITGPGAGRGSPAGAGNPSGSGNGTLLTGNVVPPPPSLGSGTGVSGSGRNGSGLGGPGDIGSVLAPPKAEGGGSAGNAIVVSSQPGWKTGIPTSGGKGSIATSPSGGDHPGLGGSGGGTSIGNGNGPGSGLAGAGPGAGKTGASPGSDPNARGGISPTPGPGGAGSSPTGSPLVPGVDVRGGTTSVVTLPSFSEGGSDPNLPGRSSVKQQQGPAITIVATSRSGGAFDFYGKLPGDNYTVYVDTAIGTAVMQFAEANPAAHRQAGALVGPQGLRTNLPSDLAADHSHARIVIKCTLDASGNLKNLQVLEPGPAAMGDKSMGDNSMTAKIMAALPTWKFRPALRGQQPVEVNAILGFNIDTNDRY